MKRCQRCRNSSLRVLRESVTYRRGRRYYMTWLSCPQCQEVNFSYRLLDGSSLPVMDAHALDELIERQVAISLP